MKSKKIIFSVLLLSTLLIGCTPTEPIKKEYKVLNEQEQKEADLECSKLGSTDCKKSLTCRSWGAPSCEFCMDIVHNCGYDSQKEKIKDECLALGRVWNEGIADNCECLEGQEGKPRGEYGILGCFTSEELCKNTGGETVANRTYDCNCSEGYNWNIRLGCTKIDEE